MTPIKRKLLYIFRGSLLRLRISWNKGDSLTLSVGYNVDKKGEKDRIKWNGNRCVANTTHGPDKISGAIINKALENLEAQIDNAFYFFEANDQIPTPQQLKEKLNSKSSQDTDLISKYFNEFLQEGLDKKNWSDNTFKSVRNLLPILNDFKKNITLQDLTLKTLDDFVQFMTKNKVSNKYSDSRKKERPKWRRPIKFDQTGYSNPVINKNIRILKWFLRWAASKGYINENLDKSFKTDLKTIKKPVIFLSWDELIKIENLDLSDNKLYDQIRDFFCFCCFTSLRFSDAHNLKKIDVKDNAIELVSQKTDTNLTIDLNTHSKRIIEKYIKSKSVYLFPRISNAVINYHLKTIAKMAGIDEPIKITQYYGKKRIEKIFPKHELISSHCARKTFICNALSMGIPPNIVMKWTGHTEYSAMLPYIDIINSVRAESMKAFDK